MSDTNETDFLQFGNDSTKWTTIFDLNQVKIPLLIIHSIVSFLPSLVSVNSCTHKVVSLKSGNIGNIQYFIPINIQHCH